MFEKVEVHPDFKEWYEEICKEWEWEGSTSHKEFAIYVINQMGFGKGLLNYRQEELPNEEMKELKTEMRTNKEKYTRAILDNNWVSREEPKFYVEFNAAKRQGNKQLLSRFGQDLKIDFSSVGYVCNNPEYYTFTEKEIKEIDERYWAFAVPVEEEQ